jgi:hypothetical protein
VVRIPSGTACSHPRTKARASCKADRGSSASAPSPSGSATGLSNQLMPMAAASRAVIRPHCSAQRSASAPRRLNPRGWGKEVAPCRASPRPASAATKRGRAAHACTSSTRNRASATCPSVIQMPPIPTSWISRLRVSRQQAGDPRRAETGTTNSCATCRARDKGRSSSSSGDPETLIGTAESSSARGTAPLQKRRS